MKLVQWLILLKRKLLTLSHNRIRHYINNVIIRINVSCYEFHEKVYSRN